MIRSLFGVALSGTLLLGWCFYYSNHLPQHLQQIGWLSPQPVAGVEIAQPMVADEQGAATLATVEGPLVFQVVQKVDEVEGLKWRFLGYALAAFLGASLLAAWLLNMAGLRRYAARVGFVFVLGLFAAVLVQTSEFLLWGQNLELTTYKSLFFVSGSLLVGLVLALFVRPQPVPVKIPIKVR